MDDDALAQQQVLVAALQGQLGAAGLSVALCETHISWVLVAGADAYKIKKAVRLPFLDFSTLDKRRHYCLEEARLNARLAPGLYLGVVAITGSTARPHLAGAGPPIEVAVHMRAFPQAALWSERIANGELGADEIDRFATVLARFHADTLVAPAGSGWGSPLAVAAAAKRNFDELVALAAACGNSRHEPRAAAGGGGPGFLPGERDPPGLNAPGLDARWMQLGWMQLGWMQLGWMHQTLARRGGRMALRKNCRGSRTGRRPRPAACASASQRASRAARCAPATVTCIAGTSSHSTAR